MAVRLPKTQTITIEDIPPSDNLVYRKRGRGFGMYLTNDGVSWKELVGWKCKEAQLKPTPKNVSVTLEITFDTLRRQDVGNRQKLTLDALQGFAYADDCQIYELILRKHVVRGKRQIIILVTEMETK